jgi:PKD repeat protein
MKLVAESKYTCKDSLTRTIHVYHKPRAQFTSSEVINCPPFDVVFNNNSISSNANYYWDFRDGYQTVTPDVRNVPHTFLNPSGPDIRNYHVRLLAESDKGCTDRDSLLIRVYPTVVANYEANMEHCSPLDQRFVNTSVNADRFFWNFDDQGVTATQRSPSHVFYNTDPDEKQFNVFMRATSNYGCVDSIQKTIRIHSSPIADFSVLPSLQYFPNATFALFNDSRPNDGNWQYHWDFKDGRTSNDKNPGTYTYGHWGIYDIFLRVANDHCSDSAYQKVILVPPVPVAAFDSSHKGCSPVVMNFKNQSTWANTYLWEFDDGKMSSLANPTHIFEKPGLYNVKLTIDGDGGKSHAYQTIEVYPNPVAQFTMQPDTAMLPDAIVKAYNQSQLGVTYLWDFGDGTFSTDKDPQHTYTELGIYNVKLVAWTEHQCPDTSNIKRIYVEGAGGIVYPNAFTPNQSGPSGGFYNPADLSNDVFFPHHDGVIEYQLEIYTRWGELIFTSDDVKVGWDGYHKGQLCKQDVYIWKVKGRYTNGKTFMKAGDVTLLR